jgi:hypothetical protein
VVSTFRRASCSRADVVVLEQLDGLKNPKNLLLGELQAVDLL